MRDGAQALASYLRKAWWREGQRCQWLGGGARLQSLPGTPLHPVVEPGPKQRRTANKRRRRLLLGISRWGPGSAPGCARSVCSGPERGTPASCSSEELFSATPARGQVLTGGPGLGPSSAPPSGARGSAACSAWPAEVSATTTGRHPGWGWGGIAQRSGSSPPRRPDPGLSRAVREVPRLSSQSGMRASEPLPGKAGWWWAAPRACPPPSVPSSAPNPSGPEQPRSTRASLVSRNREASDLRPPARPRGWMTDSVKVERRSAPAPDVALGWARTGDGDRKRFMTSSPSTPYLSALMLSAGHFRSPGAQLTSCGSSWALRGSGAGQVGDESRARKGLRALPGTRVRVEAEWAAEQWRR